jgi:hypothetical protein
MVSNLSVVGVRVPDGIGDTGLADLISAELAGNGWWGTCDGSSQPACRVEHR